MPEFDFLGTRFYLLIYMAYLSFQWFVQVYSLSSISDPCMVLCCKSHLGKQPSKRSTVPSGKAIHLKAFTKARITSQFLHFVFWWKRRGQREREEMPLLCSCHPTHASTVLYSSLVWQQRENKKGSRVHWEMTFKCSCLCSIYQWG